MEKSSIIVVLYDNELFLLDILGVTDSLAIKT